MIRILNIVGPLTYGGIESLLLSYAREINHEEYKYDFLTCSEDESDIEKEIIKTGSKVKHITRRRKNIFRHICQMYKFLWKNRGFYNIIHVHMSQESFLPLIIAKICGYKIRIAHSHTSFINNKISSIMKFKILLTNVFATDYVGCSISSCEFLYPINKNAIVLNNCIRYEDYYFDSHKRIIYRNELGLKDETALVLVGRLNPEKNHLFLCDMMKDIRLSKCKMYFIGEGIMRGEIEQAIIKNKLQDRVFLLGNRSDVKDIINAFDIFVMPSLHEGFPIVLLEAQINGLPCIVSENVSNETDISGNIVYSDLELNGWIEKICEVNNKKILRKYEGVYSYDINNCLTVLLQYYDSLLKKSI